MTKLRVDEKARRRVKRIGESLERSEPSYKHPRQTFYYFTFGFTTLDKKVCLGPFLTQQEADGKLAELDSGEVFPLRTKDLSKATRIVKAELMRRGEEPDEALRFMIHNIPKR